MVDFYNLLTARRCPELYPGYDPMFVVEKELVGYDLELREAWQKEWLARWERDFYKGLYDDVDWSDHMISGEQNHDF